jgi:hypothetical protein
MAMIGASVLRYGLTAAAEVDSITQRLGAFAEDRSTLACPGWSRFGQPPSSIFGGCS